ncbi:MAG: hypothetical protein ABSH56_10955 [Bryobacteraceae bacterium]
MSTRIDRAVRQLVETDGRASLRTRLRQEALENAERDLAIVAEWFPLEEEAAKLAEAGRPRKAPVSAHDVSTPG